MNRTQWAPLTPAFPGARRARYQPKMENLEDRTVPAVLDLVEASSCLTLSGTVAGFLPILEQVEESGSLTQCYRGALDVTIDLDAQPPRLDLSPSLAAANYLEGVWKPGKCGGTDEQCNDTLPANYAARVEIFGTAYAAIRGDLTVATAGSFVLTESGKGEYTFDSSQSLDGAQGMIDVCHASLGRGWVDVATLSGVRVGEEQGQLLDLGGGRWQLTLSYHHQFDFTTPDGIAIRVFARGTFVGETLERGGSPSGGSGPGDVVAGLAPREQSHPSAFALVGARSAETLGAQPRHGGTAGAASVAGRPSHAAPAAPATAERGGQLPDSHRAIEAVILERIGETWVTL